MEATRRDAAHVQRGAVTGFGERFVHGFVHGIVHHYIDSSLRFSACMHAHVMRLMDDASVPFHAQDQGVDRRRGVCRAVGVNLQ